MTTSQSIEAFIKSDATQDKIRILICNMNEIYVADKLGCTRREARAALKLTGRGGW